MAKILLSGRPGVGKTMIVRKVIDSDLPIAGGFFTGEIRERGRRVGFRVKDALTGDEGILAHVGCKGPARVGKYGVDVSSFERIGVAAMERSMDRDGCVVIDEIGKMELFSNKFRAVVEEIMDSRDSVLATIPVYRNPFLNTLRQRSDVKLIEVTVSNRDALPDRLIEMLTFSGAR